MRMMCLGLAATAFVTALVSPAFAKMETVAGVLIDEDVLHGKQGQYQRAARDEARPG